MLSNFQKKKKIPSQQKLLTKKKNAVGAMGKKSSSAVYYKGPVFDFEKILEQAIVYQKNTHNLKVTEKFHAPENSPTLTPSPRLK